MPDVVRLILTDHETFRHRFAELDELRDDPEAANTVWLGLAAPLEMHASAEEEHFYPALLQRVEDGEDETRDAVSTTTRSATASARPAPRRSEHS